MNMKRARILIVGGVFFGAAAIALADQAASVTQAQGQTASAECSARGKDSLRISRAREAGATAQRQREKVDRKKLPIQQAAQEKRLINAVYAKTGSAASIRTDVEARCMAEQNKVVQALLLAAAAGRLMSDAQSDSAPGAEADPASDAEPDEVTSANERPVTTHDVRKRSCPQLKHDLTTVLNQQRAGATGSAMAKLNESRRELEAALRSEGCESGQ